MTIQRIEQVTKNWWESAEVYRFFARGFGNLDFSEQAAIDMFNQETHGRPKFEYYEPRYDGKCNGYAVGKHWMDVTLAMWREDLTAGILLKTELLGNEGEKLPTKVQRIVEGFTQGTHWRIRGE